MVLSALPGAALVTGAGSLHSRHCWTGTIFRQLCSSRVGDVRLHVAGIGCYGRELVMQLPPTNQMNALSHVELNTSLKPPCARFVCSLQAFEQPSTQANLGNLQAERAKSVGFE